MSAGGQFKALYDFTATGDGMLSFKSGDQFTLVSKSNVDWWMMRSPSGEKGLVPVNYVGACKVRPEGAVTKSAAYSALYDYTGQNEGQLSFKQGEVLYLVDKTDVSWWSMQSKSSGDTGLVPVNYIDKLDMDQEHEANNGTDGHTPSAQTNGGIDDQALSEVLKSIDSNIQKLHEAAAAQGGYYSSDQRATLEKLIAHRQTVVDSNSTHKSPAHSTPTHSQSNNVQNHVESQRHHTISSSSLSGWSNGSAGARTSVTSSPTKTSSSSITVSPNLGRRTMSTSANSSPRPRRHAPPPPTGVAAANVGGASLSRKNKSKALASKDNRYSLQVDIGDLHSQQQPHFGSLPRRSGPAPPTRKESMPETSAGLSSSVNKPPLHPSVSLGSGASMQEARQAGYSSFVNPHETSPSRLQPSSVQPRRYSSDSTPNQLATPPDLKRSSSGEATPTANSSGSPQRRHQSDSQQPGGDTHYHHQLRQTASSTGNLTSANPAAANRQRSNSNRSSSSPSSSPTKDRSRSTSKEREYHRELSGPSSLGPPPVMKLDLPTNFSQSDGMELVEAVRKKTGVSHRKSLVAINEVLEFLKNRVSQCGEMVDALLSAVHETQQVQAQMSPTALRKMENTSDVERLKEIFFEITECKDDSQQRGWAVHDDQHAIMEIMEELLQILCDANPDATKLVVQEDKYENILTLITYYQMESRVPIRLLLLKVFGVLCGLDTTVISVLLNSVLPNELGRDIQQGLTDIQKTLYSSTVCTMVYSTSEAVPLPVYDQWSEEYVLFLLDTIENPPDEDEEEQIPDAFLNMILSFNQHFQDPSTNLVMGALKQRPNPRNFSEKLMFIVNRGEDPVAIAEPCCPDSMTKFLLDVFYDSSTSSMFYTTDMMVLIDIVTRQLTDLSQGDEVRTHNLELLHRIVGSTPYSEHKHRQSALSAALNRISHEEGIEGTRDLELVKKIRASYPGLFEEVTDL